MVTLIAIRCNITPVSVSSITLQWVWLGLHDHGLILLPSINDLINDQHEGIHMIKH